MPQHLWFKQKYVEPILDGTKTSTVRVKCPNYKVGDLVSFAVGPRKPFCSAVIDAIDRIAVDSLEEQHRVAVRTLYGDVEMAWRLTFHVADVAPTPLFDAQ